MVLTRSADAKPAVTPSRRVRRRGALVLGILGILVWLCSWQLCAELNLLDPTFTSDPIEIARAFGSFYGGGNGIQALEISGSEFLIGFALALVVGLLAGIAIGWWRWVEELTDPLINFGYVTPRIALGPLFVIWFGIGIESKIAMIFTSAVFPILLNTISAVKTSDPALLRVALSFKASNTQLFRTIIVPGAIPQIVTGIRLGIGLGLIGMVVGELIASTGGLGFTILQAGNSYQTATMFVALFSVSIIGVLLTQLVRRLERRLERWRPAVRN